MSTMRNLLWDPCGTHESRWWNLGLVIMFSHEKKCYFPIFHLPLLHQFLLILSTCAHLYIIIHTYQEKKKKIFTIFHLLFLNFLKLCGFSLIIIFNFMLFLVITFSLTNYGELITWSMSTWKIFGICKY